MPRTSSYSRPSQAFAWCATSSSSAQGVPQWNPVSISGYHIREAGSTAGQELAFTLADGFHYVERCLERGMAVDDFAPRLSFFFNSHNDLFEEVAKYRAARVLWAEGDAHQVRRDERGVVETAISRPDRRLFASGQTAGSQSGPRGVPGLAAVLGGCQSLHTNSMDETLALPSEHAVTLALRTQQVLAHERESPIRSTRWAAGTSSSRSRERCNKKACLL